MLFIRLIFLIGIGVIVYFAISKMSARSGKPPSPATPVALPPTKAELDIGIKDTGQDGMPVITIRSSGATLNIQSVKQDAGQYVVSVEKQADNVAVISVNKKTPA